MDKTEKELITQIIKDIYVSYLFDNKIDPITEQEDYKVCKEKMRNDIQKIQMKIESVLTKEEINDLKIYFNSVLDNHNKLLNIYRYHGFSDGLFSGIAIGTKTSKPY